MRDYRLVYPFSSTINCKRSSIGPALIPTGSWMEFVVHMVLHEIKL